MILYFSVASFLYGFVNFMLLRGTARLLRRPCRITPCLIAGVISFFYTWCSLKFNLSGVFSFMAHCSIVTLCAMISYGFHKGWLVETIVYLALNLSLGGIGIGSKGLISFAFGTAGILILSCFSGRFCDQFAYVELKQDGKLIKVKAYRDTGNMLSDPVTGKEVLIVDANVSEQLTGLTIEQLRSPVECLDAIDGLRLIPYHTISEQGKFLLAKSVDSVVIDGYEASLLIGFSPELFSSKKGFQAIIGGKI